MLTNEEILRRWDALDAELKAQFQTSGKTLDEIQARLLEIEQRAVRRGGGDPQPLTAGGQVIASEAFRKSGGSGFRGRMHIEIATKTITSASDSGGAFVAADRRPEPVLLARRRLTVRDLITQAETSSNAVEYARQTSRTNNAAAIAEGGTKPESNYAFELITAPVRTLAHWTGASKQVMDDSAVLRGTVDGELRYGLALKEEEQLLLGDGTGQNLFGIVPQSAGFSWPFAVPASPTRFDTLLAAITQAEATNYPVSGLIVNDIDLRSLQSIKDSEGRYIVSGGPMAGPVTSIWGVPVVGTPVMPDDTFVVGAFATAAQIFDRQNAVVEISTEHDDFFVKNLIAIRAEERLAFAVKSPSAFVSGTFGDASG